MKSHPTRILAHILLLFSVLVILACSKDTDLILDAMYENDQPVQNNNTAQNENSEESESAENSETSSESTSETSSEENSDEIEIPEGFESRTTQFPPIHDAHIQNGQGYNQQIIRLDEGNRISYLMFDLQPIEEIGALLVDVELQFTTAGDEGNGTINIYKGNSVEWSETNLNEGSAPAPDIFLGSLVKEYINGVTEKIPLSLEMIGTEPLSLIMDHNEGNDLAAASKEHPSTEGPKLSVTYHAPIDAPEIEFSQPETQEEETPANEAPMAVGSATPTSGMAPLAVSFSGSNSTDDSGVVGYEWDFADGSTSTAADPAHTFTNIGTYDVTLTVTDSEGLSSSDTVTITVTEQGNEAPNAVASATPINGTAPLEVSFNGSNSSDDNAITSYYWDFQDGDPSSAPNPVRTFLNAGVYQVSLTVKDEQGLSDTASVTITVEEPASGNQAPNAVASANPLTGDAPLTVTFTGSGSTDDNGIASYYWNYPGDPSSSPNNTRTFNTPGVYDITLTVTDGEGLTDSATVTITVTDGGSGGGGNPPPPPPPTGGYYVTTSGSAYSSGLSEATAWSLSHAFNAAKPGDVIYVKAGNYGSLNLLLNNAGTSGAIQFIGYTNYPGDLVSNGGSTHSYGSGLNSNLMPLLSGNGNQGTAITIYESNVRLENFQITGYDKGVITNSNASEFTGKNLIVTQMGDQNNYNAYDGFGIRLYGNSSILENCFVQNATAQAITLTDSDYSVIRNCSVYGDNPNNPTDYYFLLAGGTNNSLVENSYAERAIGLDHGGHGFNIKNDGTYNTFRNCVARRTNFELTYAGVHHNTIEGGAIYGVDTSYAQWHSNLSFIGATHSNTVRDLLIKDTNLAIVWATYDTEQSPNNTLTSNNTLINVTVNNTLKILSVGGGTQYNALASNNTFDGCTFQNFSNVVSTYYRTENIVFKNSSFNNGQTLISEAGGAYAPYSTYNGSWINNTWTNVNFNPPD